MFVITHMCVHDRRIWPVPPPGALLHPPCPAQEPGPTPQSLGSVILMPLDWSAVYFNKGKGDAWQSLMPPNVIVSPQVTPGILFR